MKPEKFTSSGNRPWWDSKSVSSSDKAFFLSRMIMGGVYAILILLLGAFLAAILAVAGFNGLFR